MINNNIPTPNISPDFTIEDIHKIREWGYERRKNATWEEELDDIKKEADEFKSYMAERRKTTMNYVSK